MRAFNLLPEQTRSRRVPALLGTTSVLAGGATLLVAVLLLVGGLFLQGRSHVSDRQDTLSAVESQIATVQAEAARKAATASAKAPEQGRLAAFDTASSARVSWDNLLDDVSRVLPAGSWISSMNMQGAGLGTTSSTTPSSTASATTPAAIPTAFTVSGVAFSPNVVAKVMRRLALIPALSEITLQSTTRADVGTTKAFQFSLTANVNAPSEVTR